MLIDYHVHSNHSHDAQNSIVEMCAAAIENGVKEIAFTEHYDPEDSLYHNRLYHFQSYYNEIQQAKMHYKGKLEIRSALELGDFLLHKEAAADVIKKNNYDFVLLSVHTIALSYLENINYRTLKETEGMQQYFINIMDTISCFDDYDCLSHLDLPKRYFKMAGVPFHILNYREKMQEILRNVIKCEKGIEVNSSTLRGLLDEPMPSKTALMDYKALGGEIITVGSDAHAANDVGVGIKACLDLLKDCGFRYITTFENRIPAFHKI